MRQAKRRGSANGRRRFAFLGGESEEKTENSEFSLTWLGASTENNEKRKTSVSDGAVAGFRRRVGGKNDVFLQKRQNRCRSRRRNADKLSGRYSGDADVEERFASLKRLISVYLSTKQQRFERSRARLDRDGERTFPTTSPSEARGGFGGDKR